MRPVAIAGLLLCVLHACTAPPREEGSTYVDPATVKLLLYGALIGDDGVARITLDPLHALDSGFVIPGRRQAHEGVFRYRFKVNLQDGALVHRVYYRNTSYAFPLTDATGAQHPLAHENFYGSWDDASQGFRPLVDATMDSGVVRGSFRIRGDPRDELRTDTALWRHRRNPRAGRYDFLFVVLPQRLIDNGTIPTEVQDIRKPGSQGFVDPFWYFLHGPGAKHPEIQVIQPATQLHVEMRPDLRAGVVATGNESWNEAHFHTTCGRDPELLKHAAFEQFIHYVDSSTRFTNIPVIADVLGNTFTPMDHDRYRAFLPPERMVATRPYTSDAPCRTVHVDSSRNALVIRNPAATPDRMRKENVAVRTRHAFTYGRYRVKCQLTRLVNDSDLWVGLTNAIWLLSDDGPGTLRRPCDNGGYMATYYGGAGDQRVPRVNYAEIDFEILRTPPYCPDRLFPPIAPQQLPILDRREAWRRAPAYDGTDLRGTITVACTNWDMACASPPAFNIGCHDVEVDGQVFTSHRWDRDYRALTQKTLAPEKELFGQPYWFEIDWRPTEIWWRIGPDPEHMRVVGYMNSSITEIANTPMRLIISQEFHNTRWWPGSLQEQDFIPFPAKDYVGEIYEVIID